MPKILNDDQINWQNKNSSRLSYEMIFRESSSKPESEDEEEELDIEALLEKKDREWQETLDKTREEAYSQGVEDGLKAGYEKAGSEIDSRIENLEEAFRKAHAEWQTRQKFIDSGLLDLVFEITENILGIPVENPAIQEKIEKELGALFQKIDEKTKPVLLISEEDYEFAKRLKERVSPATSVAIVPDKNFNTGEFSLETNHETVVHKFQTMLKDFKDSLSLPSWKK